MSVAVDSPRIESLFQVSVAAAELWGAGDPAVLFPEERQVQQRWAPKRVNEFAAGRQCARRSLQRLGVPPSPLLPQPDRRPAWPAGAVGSITHCLGFAAAVVAMESSVRSLGLDAELQHAVEPELWSRVLNAAEQDWVRSQTGSERLWATVVFSAKEAFYKCQYNVTGQWLEFQDAQVDVTRSEDEPGRFGLVTRSKGVTLQGNGIAWDGIVCTSFAWPASTNA